MKVEDLRIGQCVWYSKKKYIITGLYSGRGVVVKINLMLDGVEQVWSYKRLCWNELNKLSLSPPKKKVKRELDCWVTINNEGEYYEKYTVWLGGFISENPNRASGKLVF